MDPLVVEMKHSPGEYNRPEVYMMHINSRVGVYEYMSIYTPVGAFDA